VLFFSERKFYLKGNHRGVPPLFWVLHHAIQTGNMGMVLFIQGAAKKNPGRGEGRGR
jgi:hypothetical protein